MTGPAALRGKPLSAQDPEFFQALSTLRGVNKGDVQRYEILVNKIGRGEVLVEEIQSKLGKELIERVQARMLHHLDIITNPETPPEDTDKSRREYAAYENVLSDLDEIFKTYQRALGGMNEMEKESKEREE